MVRDEEGQREGEEAGESKHHEEGERVEEGRGDADAAKRRLRDEEDTWVE